MIGAQNNRDVANARNDTTGENVVMIAMKAYIVDEVEENMIVGQHIIANGLKQGQTCTIHR